MTSNVLAVGHALGLWRAHGLGTLALAGARGRGALGRGEALLLVLVLVDALVLRIVVVLALFGVLIAGVVGRVAERRLFGVGEVFLLDVGFVGHVRGLP